jgi:arylsulfatase A-like enzyme
MSQMDLTASLAALTGGKIPAGEARDSENHLPALLGNDTRGREYLIEQSNAGNPFALRHGSWKLFPAGPSRADAKKIMLYNLAEDLSESKNVAAEHPEKVKEMKAKLESML